MKNNFILLATVVAMFAIYHFFIKDSKNEGLKGHSYVVQDYYDNSIYTPSPYSLERVAGKKDSFVVVYKEPVQRKFNFFNGGYVDLSEMNSSCSDEEVIIVPWAMTIDDYIELDISHSSTIRTKFIQFPQHPLEVRDSDDDPLENVVGVLEVICLNDDRSQLKSIQERETLQPTVKTYTINIQKEFSVRDIEILISFPQGGGHSRGASHEAHLRLRDSLGAESNNGITEFAHMPRHRMGDPRFLND